MLHLDWARARVTTVVKLSTSYRVDTARCGVLFTPGRAPARRRRQTFQATSSVLCADSSQQSSTASATLLVPRARTATGQRSFAINGPRTWNSLPADLRTPDTTLCSSSVISRPTCFSSSLRCCWQVGSAPFVRRRCDCLASSAPFTNIQTYLLTYLLIRPVFHARLRPLHVQLRRDQLSSLEFVVTITSALHCQTSSHRTKVHLPHRTAGLWR